MKKIILGTSNLKVSEICLGTMTFGEQNTEKEAHEQLSYAVDNGVNFIDTAELYAVPSRKETQGLTEKYIGTWLNKRQDRDQLIIASKIAGPGEWVNHIRKNPSFSKSHITEAIDKSLARLQTDYIDLYQLHWPERPTNFFGQLGYSHASDQLGTDFQTVLETLKEKVDEGKIRAIGLSNETPWGVMRFVQCAEMFDLPKVVSVQNPYSLLNRTFEVGMSEVMLREQIAMIPYSPLGFGVLSGKYKSGYPMPPNARLTLFGDKLKRYSGPRSWQAMEAYVELAKAHGLSPAQMALAFVNSRDFVTSTIIGATNLKQLKENIESTNITLSTELINAINLIHNNNPNPAP